MPLEVDWENELILITSPTTNVDAQVLHDFIEDQMASARGSTHDDILVPEGKIEDPNNPGVYSQIIIQLNTPWQIQFWGGSGYTRIYGGKLVGGLNDEPMKATGTAGDITVLESPVDGLTVVSGSGVVPQDIQDIADAVWDEAGSGHESAGSMGLKMKLIEAILRNDLILTDGDTDNLVIATDDGLGVLLRGSAQSKGGAPVALNVGPPVNRDRLEEP